jgi:hypothetical protein
MADNHSLSTAWPPGTIVRLLRPLVGVECGALGVVIGYLPIFGAYTVRFETWSAVSLIEPCDLEEVAERRQFPRE